jgi:hypothetical protein
MKIGYSETFPLIGKDRWQKNWLEDEVQLNLDLVNCTDEDIAKAMLNVRKVQYALQKQVQSFFYESNKAAEKALKEVEKETITPTDSIINDIRSCKSIKVLEAYKLIAKSNKTVQEAYDNHLKLLTNG